ncbi:PREDICTED: MAM domain-containing glycosylphosphatidylinositol anchor protein 1-like [Eufriesea mexicana]|nr:PREDICTED: MAM domain-containing glycosylphosphatidylinositol anchor protein 1-like [Eufriesea mexicana]
MDAGNKDINSPPLNLDIRSWAHELKESHTSFQTTPGKWLNAVARLASLFSKSSENKIGGIIELAKSIGDEGFVDVAVEDVQDLLVEEKVDEADLMEMTSEAEGQSLAENLESFFLNADPSAERNRKFKRELQNCLAPYREIYNYLVRTSKQIYALSVPPVAGFEPDFVRRLENITISQGRDATFTCVVSNLGGYRVSPSSSASGDHSGGAKTRVAWIKADTKAVLAIDEHVITNNARLSVTHSDYNTWTLNIRGVRREDRGIYMCQVNTNPMKSQSAFLEVVIPPDIISEETSNDLMVPEGGSAKLVCKARGFPKPEISWKREDGVEIISRVGASGSKTKIASVVGETLTLSKVSRSEMGTYLCIASNGVPPSVSKRMTLHVHFHPMVQVPNQLVGAPTGTNVTLICLVEASPKAIHFWTRETGEMIISNHKYAASDIETSVYGVQMRLVIMNLQKQDLGGYKCISKNSIGDAEGTIRLYDMDLPKHSRKPGDRRGDDDMNEAINDPDHRLNHVYQGSLRETGSTLEPYFDDDDVYSSTSSNNILPPASCILLIAFSHMLAFT